MTGGERPDGGRPTWWIALLLAVAGLALTALARPPLRFAIAGGDAAAALAEGNRLARGGRPEEAMAAYAAGWPADAAAGGGWFERAAGGSSWFRRAAGGSAGGVLAYNLGTTAHRLGRLPEAVLWYRRAVTARLDDPWLHDNLELARAEVGAVVLPPPGWPGRLAGRTGILAAVAVALAWGALALYLRPPRARRRAVRWGWIAAGAAALAVWCLAVGVDQWGPRPAVLLTPCEGPAGPLPAGSEVWVGRPAAGVRAVAGGPPGLVCPETAVGAVE